MKKKLFRPVLLIVITIAKVIFSEFLIFLKLEFFWSDANHTGYDYPWEENLSFYVIISIRNFFAIFGTENYSITTTIFLWVINILGIALILFILYRRKVLGKRHQYYIN